jgi:Tol biopolymer transport system component
MAMRRFGTVALVVLIATGCQQPWIELASRDTSGDGANGDSSAPALSADGRYVASVSDADDLVPGDTNDEPDVFVRDLQTRLIELVSVGAGGVPADGPSLAPSISADGDKVVFHSDASNIAPDFPARGDVFIRDRSAGTTVAVSRAFNPGGTTDVGSGAISGDGSTIWFTGSAAIGSLFGAAHVVYDVATGALSFPPSPWQLPFFLDDMGHGSVSFDGRYAVVAQHTLPAPEVASEVYRIDRVSANVAVVPQFDNPSAPASPCSDPAISSDGGRVAFVCATDRILAGAPSSPNVYARDIASGTTFRVSVDAAGGDNDGHSLEPALNSDGSEVAFSSTATDLVAGDTNGTTDVFVRALQAGINTRVSLDRAEAVGNHLSPSLGDGDFVAFTSDSDAIVPGDADGTTDVLVRAVHVPRVLSATPSVVARGTSATLTVVGESFGPDTIVGVSPAQGVNVDSVVSTSSTQLRVSVTVASSAAPGPRRLNVLVPGPGPGINNRAGSSDHCQCLTVS